MKEVIIGIHGLGNKPPKHLLQKWWKDAMLEGMHMHNIQKRLPKFELVYWADILHDKPLDRLTKDKENPYYLDEPYRKSSKNYTPEEYPFRKKILDFISNQLNKIFLNEDNSLNYTYISDFILRRYFKDLDVYYTEECKGKDDKVCKARELIQKRLVDTLLKYNGYKIMLVAHSMGSIITFDVLTFLLTEYQIDTLVTIGSPLGLPVVISKIAAEQKKMNGESIMVTPPCITRNWYNMADILDHVALNYKLSDDFSSNQRGVQPTDFMVNNNYMINEHKNPHKSFGYLRTEEFSKVLSEFIGEEKLIFRRLVQKVQNIIGKVKFYELSL